MAGSSGMPPREILKSQVHVWCPLCGTKSGKFILKGDFGDGAIGYSYHCGNCNFDFNIFDNKEK